MSAPAAAPTSAVDGAIAAAVAVAAAAATANAGTTVTAEESRLSAFSSTTTAFSNPTLLLQALEQARIGWHSF